MCPWLLDTSFLPSVVRLNCLTRLREAKQVAFIQPEDVVLVSICLYNSCAIRLIEVTYVPLISGVWSLPAP
jgi:hypothetical protein